jgi:TonB family protein
MTSLLSVPNLLAWSAQIAVVIGAALLALRLLRLEAPSVRYVLLRVLLVLCLLLPLVQPRVPAYGRADAGAVSTLITSAETGVAVPAPYSSSALVAWLEMPWVAPLTVLLLLGVVARLAWIAAGVVRLQRLRRVGECAPASGEHDELQHVIGTRANIRYVSGLGQPVTFGFRSPVVLLPDSLRVQPEPIQRAVLAHELWHVRRRDWIWTVVEEAVRAIFWFHPAMWILLSRIQSTREEVVDELTVLATGSRRSYVDALLAYADASPIFAATAFARRRHLVHRMVLISKEVVMSARRVVACGAALAAVVVSTSWYAVHAFPLAQDRAASLGLSTKPGPIEQRAKAITPENPIPRRTSFVPADYPTEAEAAGARGTMTVRVVLDESGRVAETRIAGLSLSFYDNKVGLTSNGPAFENIDRSMQGTFCCTPDGRRESFEVFRGTIQALGAAAIRAVTQWSYAAPADGPVAFSVYVPFGAAGAEPPPPPPPPPPPGAGAAQGYNMANGAIRVGGDIKAPMKLRNVNPVYPPAAQASNVQGVVIIETRIEPDGRVGDAHVLRSIPMLDEAALEAVRQWEFAPTLMNGQPVPVIMTVTVNFTLQ